MTVSGIVCEYNPFHKGHEYHINYTRKSAAVSHVVGVMSGNFVQRGDFAIYDKWTRAKYAVMGGIDLVIELPTFVSLSSAESFAFGAVKILDLLNCVDYLSFGSECGDVEKIKTLADKVNSIQPLIADKVKSGMSYHRAVDAALGQNSYMNAANDLLGIEYVRALKKLGSSILPFTVQRVGQGHDSKADTPYPSASFIRGKIAKGQEYYPESQIHMLKYMETAVLAKLRTMDMEQMQSCANVSEGIERRVAKAAKTATNLTELYDSIKTKRYPMSRVRRVVMSLFLDMRQYDIPYIKVLAFNDKGRQLISHIKEKCPVPVITKASEIDSLSKSAKELFAFENKATDLFALACTTPKPSGLEYTMSPIYINSQEK